jgi:uncharacterized protein (TIGR02996 family)
MTHEDAFLQDILENYDDDIPRRIYADWLMDHGDAVASARGELIHLQCQLAQTAPDAKKNADLLRRERELIATYGRLWGAVFQRLGCRCWEYRRGFVEGVGIPAAALLSHADTLFRLGPIRELKLYHSSGLLGDVAACPHLANIRILDLENNELNDADVAELSESPHLMQVHTLFLWSNRVGDTGVRSLCGGTWPRVEQLDLSSNIITDDGVAALADSLFLRRLTRLALSRNQIGDTGARALAASPYSTGLFTLDIGKNAIGPDGTAALREKFTGRVQLTI